MTKSIRVVTALTCSGLLMAVLGCADRRITTSVQDQAFVPAPPPPAPPVAKAPEPPPPPVAKAPEPPPPPEPAPEQKIEQPAAAPPAAVPAPVLTDVFFDFDRSTIRPDGQAALEADYKQIKELNGPKLVIEGHCDERGTVEYNLVLGERRAQAVQRYLEDLGMPASQFQIVSYGKERPFCAEHNTDCWQKNRRAHLVLQ
jgi:peptidoglycan-associated lipoprotein